MALRTALIIDGSSEGAEQALTKTAEGVKNLGTEAGKASQPVSDIARNLDAAGTAADGAATGVFDMGEAAVGAAPKLGNLKTIAIGFIGGVAGAFATAGLTALIGAASGAFTDFVANIVDSSGRIDEKLERHKALVDLIKGAWTEADDAASDYGLNAEAVLQFENDRNIERLESELPGSIPRDLARESPFTSLMEPAVYGPLLDPIEDLRASIAAGTPDVIAFREAIAGVALEADDPRISGLTANLLATTEQAAALQAELQRARDLQAGFNGDAEAAATALGGLAEDYDQVGGSVARSLPAFREYVDLLRSIAALENDGGGSGPPPPPSGGGGFAAGGFTGMGGRGEVAGVVHGQEFVVNAQATARNRGLLEAINAGLPGFAAGGLAGAGGLSSGIPIGVEIEIGSGAGASVGEAANDMSELNDEIGENVELTQSARGAFSRLFVEMKYNLREGQSWWEALGNAGANALDTVADKALSMAGEGIFDLIAGAFSGGISGGGAGGLGSIVTSLFGFAEGGWTGYGPTNAVAGPVHGQEFVVRAGPAARNRNLLEALNSGHEVGGGFTFAPQNTYYVTGDGVTMQQVQRAVEDSQRQQFEMFGAVYRDRARRGALGTAA